MGGVLTGPVFGQVDGDLLGPDEDLCFYTVNTRVHSPKSTRPLSICVSAEKSTGYSNSTRRAFFIFFYQNANILRHPLLLNQATEVQVIQSMFALPS